MDNINLISLNDTELKKSNEIIGDLFAEYHQKFNNNLCDDCNCDDCGYDGCDDGNAD